MNDKLSGGALALGAICIWLAWWLMPDAATNDAAHILDVVAAARDHVHASALLQLLGAALLIPGLLAEARATTHTGQSGAVILLIGSLGMAADAVYHQLAYEMTAAGIDRLAVVPIMIQMQTVELRPLVPLLLAFVVGAPILGWQLARRGPDRTWAARLLLAPAITLPLGILAAQTIGLPRRVIVLLVLAEICGGLAWVGLQRLIGNGVTR